jgi:hypothetical protein
VQPVRTHVSRRYLILAPRDVGCQLADVLRGHFAFKECEQSIHPKVLKSDLSITAVWGSYLHVLVEINYALMTTSYHTLDDRSGVGEGMGGARKEFSMIRVSEGSVSRICLCMSVDLVLTYPQYHRISVYCITFHRPPRPSGTQTSHHMFWVTELRNWEVSVLWLETNMRPTTQESSCTC